MSPKTPTIRNRRSRKARTIAKWVGKCKLASEVVWEREALDTKTAVIQPLIPLEFLAVLEVLNAEVTALVGARCQRAVRQPGHVRRSQQQGDERNAVGYRPTLVEG